MTAMTRKDDTPIQVYIPALRRERAPYALPETVLFIDPGLPQTAEDPGAFHPETYPFSREEAARVLDELLTVGESLDVAGPTGKSAALRGGKPGGSGTGGTMTDEEKSAIARFASTGTKKNDTPEKDADFREPARAPRIAAQKILLLAWDLENRLAEIAALRKQVAEAVKPLTENLHGQETGDPLLDDLAKALPGALPESLADLPADVEPDWRLTLAAAAAFLPENAVLVTGHNDLRGALDEAGLLQPLPEEAAALLDGWPVAMHAALRHARAPLWKILGRTKEPENTPWLCAAPEILVLPPEGK